MASVQIADLKNNLLWKTKLPMQDSRLLTAAVKRRMAIPESSLATSPRAPALTLDSVSLYRHARAPSGDADARDKPGHDDRYAASAFFSGALIAPDVLISPISLSE